MTQVDPSCGRRVGSFVSRFAAMAFALTVAAGCGGANKGTSTTPGSTGTVTSEDGTTMNDQDPVGGGTIDPGATDGEPGAGGDDGGPDDGVAGGPSDGDTTGTDAGPPPIQPPNLDPAPAEVAETVAQHVQAGERALSAKPADPDEALKQARLALEADAANVDAVVLMAHAYYQKRLYDTAEVVLDMLTSNKGERGERAKRNAGVYYVYGLIYEKTDNDPRRAMVNYTKAVQLDPSYTSALINYGAQLLRNKRYDEAIRVFERLTGELNVTAPLAWNNLGSAYRGRSIDYQGGSRVDLIRRAETAYKRAIQADKNYGPAYYNLGLLYLDAEEYPGPNGPLDKLERLQRAKTYFEQYQSMPGVNQELLDEQMKLVTKLIKREEKARKSKDAGW